MKYLIAFIAIVTIGCAPAPKIVTIEGHRYIKQESISGHGVSMIHAESCPCKNSGKLEQD